MRRLQAGILLLALAATAGGLYLVYTAHHEENKVLVATANLVLIWAFIGTGLIAWARRPENRFGLLMTAVGLSWIFGALNEANNAYVYAAGSILGGIGIAVFIHALLAFPRGYLESRLVYAAVGTAYGLVLLGPLIYNLFSENACPDNSCPRNVLFVHDSSVVRNSVGAVAVLGAAFIIIATIGVLVRRWRAASPPLRRQLAPVFTTSAATLLLIGLAIAISFVTSRGSDIVWYFVIFAFAMVPLAFLAGLLHTRLARTAVARLVLDLEEAEGPGQLLDALRRALGDPSLKLAYWLPDRRRWIDVSGWEIDIEAEAQGRGTALVEHEGEIVAALIHDPTLREQHDLVHAVSAAARLALARDRTVQALRQSESRYRALLDAMPDLMFRMSRDGTYLDWKGNPADLAAPPEELIGANARDILPREVAERLQRGIERALDTGEVETGEYKLTLDGVERTFEARIVRDGDEVVLIVRDFTERELLHDQLARERDFIRTVVDAAPSFFCLVDPEGCIVRYNRTLELTSGRPDTEAVRGSKLWDVFIVSEDRDAVRREFAELVASERPGEYESHWVTAEGERLLVAWTITPLTDEEGRPRFLVSGIDITHRKRHEEELRRSRVRLVHAGDEARRKLERNLHDGAQQRLVSLSLGLRLAQSRLVNDPEEAKRLLEGASDELAHALEELRELARGIHPAVLSERGLVAALETLAGRAPFQVGVTAPEERFPAAVEAAVYYVVSEALANVTKYAQASAVEVNVTRMNGHAVVEIADDGVGGADPTRGSGLSGLADRVEALDGVLWVESRPGSGTRIRAEIPCG